MFNRQWALVTGAAQRLGRQIAIELANGGWNIALHCRNSLNEAKATQADIQATGAACEIIQADLAQPAEVENLYAKANNLGVLRCVVNNASLFEFDCATDLSERLFHKHMAVNLYAPLQLARMLHAHTAEGEQGVVVNLLDQKLDNMNPDFLSYTLSKAGLRTATHMLATELAPRLRVVGVAPGLTMISHMQTQEQFEKAHQISPLNRSSQPDDIAKAVKFLVDSPAITGTTLVVDGGQHLVPMARDFSMMQS
ncbi:MAG: SDR family oxidoreductase [Limnobacter sp.]|nr:SDR family oxidoreductase [Limnobacter sp.]